MPKHSLLVYAEAARHNQGITEMESRLEEAALRLNLRSRQPRHGRKQVKPDG